MLICRSPQSLTYVSSWGFTRLPPSCNSNYLESMNNFLSIAGVELGLCQPGLDFGFHSGGIEAKFGAHFLLGSLWDKEIR
ncbi:hypothetical protein AAG94_06685 [Escherichia albertii]|nr:hypothetical protein [Escherichia albertii]EFO0967768.1 hypothetical protein [Escherichia albertii]EFO4718272.1 hypothetical protein [Escherichia albertii]